VNRVDLLVVGAGPAGMAAAIGARRTGLEVAVVDDQPTPGGQIWRSIELSTRRDEILGPSYVEGRAVAEMFRACGAIYLSGAQLWQVEPGFRAFVSRDRRAEVIESHALIFATGAQERPVPFPGWTLPGVLTVGAAQILLKNAGQIPVWPAWIAGSGPLPLLYAMQLLRAGGQLAGYLDTTPAGQWRAALRHLPRALRASSDLIKGLGWMSALRKSHLRPVKGITHIEALGRDRIEALRYRSHSGAMTTVEAGTLLVHEGVVPNIHPALSLDCAVAWDTAQDCYTPLVDRWGESSRTNLFIAGDGAGIAGAKAAQLRGELAALRVAAKLGCQSEDAAEVAARPIRRKLRRELAARPFLDALFKPRTEVFAPADETIVCRCEEITAGEIRALATVGRPGPNQMKAATRAGMGSCQGRQCGYTVTRILGACQNRLPSEVGFFNIRPPLKPVTLGELASLDQSVTIGPKSGSQDRGVTVSQGQGVSS
jgi:NADPH-dependent 2,4-dienoyl-CoA reductase/sulfur reductase-like enzyme